MVQAIGAQRAGMDVDSAGAVMGASTQQMRGAVLGRLRADFSLVAMKAGCLRAFEALRGGGAAAVPPASAAALPGVGLVLVPPSSVAFAAPVVQAVAVSAGGGSGAGVLGGAGWGGSRPWIFAVWVVVFPRFGRMLPGLYEFIQYTLSFSGQAPLHQPLLELARRRRHAEASVLAHGKGQTPPGTSAPCTSWPHPGHCSLVSVGACQDQRDDPGMTHDAFVAGRIHAGALEAQRGAALCSSVL